MANRILTIFFLFFIQSILWGQKIDKDYVIQQNRIASDLNREGKFEKANRVLDELLSKLKAENASDKYFATTYQTKAKVVQSLGNYQESSQLARQSLLISIKHHDSINIADSYNTIGINHYFESDYDSTTYYYEKSFEIKKNIKTDPYALAVSAYNLALVFDDQGQLEEAMELYHQAESLLLESDHSKNFLSDVYVGMALIYFYSGEITKADIYAEKAMEKGLISYGEFNPNMTFVYTTYANILEADEKYSEAVALLEKNLKIRKSAYGKWHRWTCETYYDLANSYVLMKNYDKAEEYYKEAIEIGKKINSQQYLANASVFLAELYIDREIHLDKAEELVKSSLETNIKIYGNKSDIVADNYLQLADLYKLKGDTDRFLRSVQNCLKASNYSATNLGGIVGPFQTIRAMMLLGDWYRESFEKDASVAHLLEAYKLVDQKTALIKQIQDNFSSDRSRIDFANKYREVFEMDIGLCWLLYHKTKDKGYLQKAFELSETNRNTTLLEGLQGIKYRAYGEIPKEKLEEEQSVKKELERVKREIFYEKSNSKPDKVFYQSLLDERIVLSNKIDSIHEDFNKNYPKFKNVSSANNLLSIEDVQDQLDKDTQVITYFLGDKSLFTFNITKDTVSLLRADIAGKLVAITNDFKNHLSKREDIRELSSDLYMYLLGQQMVPEKKDMVVIADNVLNFIPFEILRSTDGSLIVENYNVSYSGSVRLFLELEKEFYSYDSEQKWAGFAPEYADGELEASQKEIDEIADLTGGVKFVGKAAKKQNFFTHSKEFSIFHFAMHAKIDNENPLYNRLIFDDGELTASELYATRSKANLAVLSACNTGFGKIEKGEGVMSMARAFHLSGIPSVVMSLWKVPDKETKSIMVDFYKYLKKGRKKSEALRLAKLDYLKENAHSELSHPYYWSGFVINGNTDPIMIGNPISSLVWIFWGICGLLLAVYLYKRLNGSTKVS